MQSQNSTPLTLDEHRELGREISEIHRRLRELSGLVTAVYGPVNRASFSFLKSAEAMNRLCQDLQTQAAKDLPGYPVDNLYR
jgi:hypothetical protein